MVTWSRFVYQLIERSCVTHLVCIIGIHFEVQRLHSFSSCRERERGGERERERERGRESERERQRYRETERQREIVVMC